MTRSLVFMGVLVPLALYIVTSSGSAVGGGLVLSLLLGLVLELWLFSDSSESFQSRFGWQINHTFTLTTIKYVLSFFCSIFRIFNNTKYFLGAHAP